MKIAKKALSMFLSLLMIFTACYVGIDGAYTAYAAEGDSKYTAQEVIDAVNAATSNGQTYSSSADTFNLSGDDGKVIAAAERIFDYAVKTYREGRQETSKGNSSKALYDYFTAEFKSKYTNSAAADSLVKSVLDPAGVTIYSYENQGTKSNKLGETTTAYTQGNDVSANFPLASYSGYYASGASAANVSKEVNISLDIDKFLQTFSTVDEIPSSFLVGVEYTYAHVGKASATVTSVTTRDETTGSGCNEVTTTYYTPTIATTVYNYMTAKPVRVVTKNTTAKKYLKSVLKFFNEEVLAYSQEDLLEMSLEELAYLDSQALDFFDMMNNNFNDATLAHFGVPKAAISAFIERLAFAHKVVAANSAIATMDALVGSEYNVESYSQMSALYNQVNAAYVVVDGIKSDVKEFILANYPEYAEKYSSINMTEAAEYIAELFEVMTE